MQFNSEPEISSGEKVSSEIIKAGSIIGRTGLLCKLLKSSGARDIGQQARHYPVYNHPQLDPWASLWVISLNIEPEVSPKHCSVWQTKTPPFCYLKKTPNTIFSQILDGLGVLKLWLAGHMQTILDIYPAHQGFLWPLFFFFHFKIRCVVCIEVS